jgi:hypothetical protein
MTASDIIALIFLIIGVLFMAAVLIAPFSRHRND